MLTFEHLLRRVLSIWQEITRLKDEDMEEGKVEQLRWIILKVKSFSEKETKEISGMF